MNKESLLVHTPQTVQKPAVKKEHLPVTNVSPNTIEALPEILFITTYPPRECGIATYSFDLLKALNNKYENSFRLNVCALESEDEKHIYHDEPKFILNTDRLNSFGSLLFRINNEKNIQLVVIQHEFAFFAQRQKQFTLFLQALIKPVVFVFHTVLPRPNDDLKKQMQELVKSAKSVIVMTHYSADLLKKDYDILEQKISVIPHGTHLVSPLSKESLKTKYDLSGKTVLSTFGLLNSGKSIETSLDALPAIIARSPQLMFLIIGKTHPSVVKHENEKYRKMLENKVVSLQLENHVRFVNKYVPLPDLLEYLQLTDVYLFTSKDPNQAVSGTFSYALACGCPVVSTPIPHASEVLKSGAGIIVDFENSSQLSDAVNTLLQSTELRESIASKALQKMASTAWENSAIAHAELFQEITNNTIHLHLKIPRINIHHIKRMTTDFGMIQFSIINKPDIESGYTIDDNARALIALCQHYQLTKEQEDIPYIETYYNVIKYCLQTYGRFLNYINKSLEFTNQNYTENLDDSNGRALWALGYLIGLEGVLPETLINDARNTMNAALKNVHKIHSTRAMAFAIKGIFFSRAKRIYTPDDIIIVELLANRMVQMYKHESDDKWKWFESYLTYGNSALPEALLCAGIITGNTVYKDIAVESFEFLLSKTFKGGTLKVISNNGWLHRGKEHVEEVPGGEQPLDVAYTILALQSFYDYYKTENYREKIYSAFSWFLGNNHLHQIVYNPYTGGCYDGIEESGVNLNQGAESAVCYLMARLTIEKITNNKVS